VYSTNAQNTSVELIDMNVVYAGLDNPTRIASSISTDKMVVTTSKNLHYNEGVITTTTMDDGMGYVCVGELKRGDTLWRDTVLLRIKSLPKPRAQLGGIPNDGLPKGRAQILAQTRIIVSMGSGFAPSPFNYRVTSYELIVVYKGRPPYMERGYSNEITSTMRGAIKAAHDADYFIIRKIEAIEKRLNITYELGPIYTFLRGRTYKKSEFYAKVSWPEEMGRQPVITSTMLECAELLDGIDEGTLDFYQTTEIGFVREQYVYKDSQIVAKSLYDDKGHIKTSRNLLPDNVWEYKIFYSNGQTKIHTFYKLGDVLLANDSFAMCWDQAMINLNWSSSALLKPEDCFINKLPEDLYWLYAISNIAAYHNFKSYYENGELKCEGGLVRIQGRESNNMSWGCERSAYYEYDNHTLMDEEWNFYNEDGTLIKTIIYDNGTEIK
jgi:antitoxin component YwqK of YwqJK toxin-antitoxin module